MTRGKGEGSIYRRADGRWVGVHEAGRCPGGHPRRDGTTCRGGERRRAHIVRRTKAEVTARMAELRDRAASGVRDPNRTVESYLEYWLTDVIASEVSAGTLNEYTKRVARIVPEIGHIKLERLTKTHVQGLANRLAERYPRSPKTRSITLATLRQALRWAVPELIPRNPAEYVKGPKGALAKLDDAFDAEEAAAVLAQAKGTRLEAFFWFALKYGLRIGELIALRWEDIHADELSVNQSKTESGIRTLPLVDEAQAILAEHRRRQAAERLAASRWDDPGLVFASELGQTLRPQAVRVQWTELLTAAGISHRCRNCDSPDPCSTSVRRFHASRHTAATLLLEAGVELEVVSAILGHANIQITADIYAKVRSDLKRKGLKRLG